MTVDQLIEILNQQGPINDALVDNVLSLFKELSTPDLQSCINRLTIDAPKPRIMRLNDELAKRPQFHDAMERLHKMKLEKVAPVQAEDAEEGDVDDAPLTAEEIVVEINHVLAELEPPVTEDTIRHAREQLIDLQKTLLEDIEYNKKST